FHFEDILSLETLDRFAARSELLDTSEIAEILSLNVTICPKSIKKCSFYT
ncbi:MAG: hypothetical protein ACI97N_001812, partial [Cognaticolwellia sp.]